VVICSLLILQGLLMALTAMDVRADAIVGLFAVLAAAAIGLLTSFTTFKNKGWYTSDPT